MNQVRIYPLGRNVINLAPNMILVNGTVTANSFKDFIKWIKDNNVDVTWFHNWPFEFGISSKLK